MCIIIHKPAGVTLKESLYETCFTGNPHGAGFSYVEDGKLHIEKGFFSHAALMSGMKNHHHRDLVVHYRFATHGAQDARNCHPWPVTDCHEGFSFAIHHNGILDHRSTKVTSDTGCFVEDILDPLLRRDPWFLQHEYGVTLLENMIGSHNKMVIHRSDGAVFFLNREAGVEDLGCWFSNFGYEPYIDRFQGFSRKGGVAHISQHLESGVFDANGDLIPDEFDEYDDPYDDQVDTDDLERLLTMAEQYEGAKGTTPRALDPQSSLRKLRSAFKNTFPEHSNLREDELDAVILENGNAWY